MRLAESERRVMALLWEHGEMAAREIAGILLDKLGWSKTTTYTMLTRCEKKGYIRRQDPYFICIPLISREQAQQWETDALLEHYFGGDVDLMVASLIGRKKLSLKQLDALSETLRQIEGEEK